VSDLEYQVYSYPGSLQKKGRDRIFDYLKTFKDPELGASIGLTESTVMMLERMKAKALWQLEGKLYRRMAVGEWAAARTVISLKALASMPKEEYDAKPVSRPELYNRVLAEIDSMVDQVGRTAFLATPEAIYSVDYLKNRVLPEIIKGLAAPRPIPHLLEPKNGYLLRSTSISPLHLFTDLLGSPYYGYPAGKVPVLRAATISEISVVPRYMKDPIVARLQQIRGFRSEYNSLFFDKAVEVHGPLGSGFVQRTKFGGYVRIVDLGQISFTTVPEFPLSTSATNAIAYVSRSGFVPVTVLWHIFGEGPVNELDRAISGSLGFAIKKIGSAYVTQQRVNFLKLNENDPLVSAVCSNLVEIWQRTLPWLWGDKEKIKAVQNQEFPELLEDVSAETYTIARVLKELYEKGAFRATNPIERSILGYLGEKHLAIPSVIGPSDHFEVNPTQADYLSNLARVAGAIV